MKLPTTSGLIRYLLALTVALSIFLPAQSKNYSKRHKHKFNQACNHIKGKRFKKAHKHLKSLAKAGDPKAQTLLGLLYEKGVGVEKSTEKAISYYEKAAMQGLPEAESQLGHLLLSLEKESEVVSLETASWLKKAALHGQTDAQVTLGRMAVEIKNSPINQNEAVWYLRDAAKKGNDQAKSLLNKIPKPPSSALGNPAQQVSAGVQGLQKSWTGYANLTTTINNAASAAR